MSEVNAETLVDALAEMLEEKETQTLRDTLTEK